MDNFLTRREAAELLDVDRATIARLEYAQKIVPAYIPPTKTGARLYDLEDVLALKNTLEQEGEK